jgi:flagellar basal body-associated protein FliL
MLSQEKTGKKTILVVATLMLIAAGSFILSRSGSTEDQAGKKAKAAEASIMISPLDLTLQHGKTLPVGSWGDPF